MKNKSIKILSIIALLLVYFIFLFHCLDSDMFFTIASGNDILHGNFYHNSLTNLPIIVQQWLYAVILAIFDNIGGFIGCMLFVAIQDGILWFLSYKFLYKKTNRRFLSIFCSLALIILTFEFTINVRPQITTLIFLLLEILILEKYKEIRNWKDLLWLIPVLILYANFHQAVYLYCIMIIIPYLFEEKADKNLIITTISMPFLSIFTPYGINGFTYIYKTFLSGALNKLDIIELRGMPLDSRYGIVAILMLLSIFWFGYKKQSNAFINFYGVITFGLLLTRARHVDIIYIPLLFVLVLILPKIKIQPAGKVLVLVMSILLIIPAALVNFSYGTNLKKTVLNGLSEEYTLVENLDIPKDAKIYNTINIGSYLEYFGYNTYIDMRPELYTPDYNNNRLNKYLETEIYYEEPDFLLSNFDYAILNNKCALNEIFENLGYRRVTYNKTYSVWNIKTVYKDFNTCYNN